MRWPSSRISPPATRPGGSSRPMMAAPVSDLPAPDSPTTPRISPGAISKEMSSSARSVPRRVRELDDAGCGLRAGTIAARVQRSRGLSASRSQSPSRFTLSAISTSIDAGEHGDPPFAREQEVVADADQRAQRGRGRRHAHAQEGQRGLGDDRRRHLDGRQHQHRAHARSAARGARMMRSGETPVTRAACTYSLLRSTSVEPRTVRAYCTQPVSEIARISTPKATVVCASGNSARPTPAISKRDQDRRERQHHVAQPHEEGVEPAADEAGQQAQRDADQHRQQHRGQADDQRDARAVHQRREDVAPLVVGAEQVLARCPPAPRPAAGARRRARAWPGRRGCAATPSRRTPRRRCRRTAIAAAAIATGERAKAVADIAVEPAGEGLVIIGEAAKAGPHRAGPRACVRRWTASALMLIHLKNMKLSASCVERRPSCSRPRPATAGAAAGGRCRPRGS